MQDNDLHKLQNVLFEMLKLIDKICRDNDIKYSLSGGTLLGAIRHKGFIPWDDDVDIAMSRDQYEKFIDVWNTMKPEGYILQCKENTPNYTQAFAKIRKNSTTFIQFEWEKNRYNTGVFIDVFPLDRIPKGKLKRRFFQIKGILFIIYLRDNQLGNCNKLITFVSSLVYSISTKRIRKNYCQKYIQQLKEYNENKLFNFICVDSFDSLNKLFTNTLCDDYVHTQFESGEFMCYKNWENYLTTMYGDYMSLPPEEERVWKHHPLVLDFEHSFDEIEKA